jgi:hypothetical protein
MTRMFGFLSAAFTVSDADRTTANATAAVTNEREQGGTLRLDFTLMITGDGYLGAYVRVKLPIASTTAIVLWGKEGKSLPQRAIAGLQKDLR